MPPHIVVLKIGAPVMCMRNIDPPYLVNGTRLRIKVMDENLLKADILVGAHAGEEVTIPRIPFIPNGFSIEMKRYQFPVKLSFSMSINKAQGQTLSRVGLYLEENCFSHGQLYVGCSRVGSQDHLKIFCPNNRTKNVVFKEVFGEIKPM